MIQDNDLYTFTIDHEYIRMVCGDEFTDEECDHIANEIDMRFDAFIARVARDYRLGHPINHGGVKVQASATHQTWSGWKKDYAVNCGEVFFDCHLALDQFKLSELPMCADDLHSIGALDYGDELFFEAVRLGLTESWDGPFECYIEDEDAYQDYLAERVKREYGYEITDREE